MSRLETGLVEIRRATVHVWYVGFDGWLKNAMKDFRSGLCEAVRFGGKRQAD